MLVTLGVFARSDKNFYLVVGGCPDGLGMEYPSVRVPDDGLDDGFGFSDVIKAPLFCIYSEVNIMEFNIFQHLIELAPGFIGVATSKLFDGDTRQESLEEDVLKYFLYASVSWVLANLIVFALGFAIPNISEKFTSGLTLFIAAVAGMLWTVYFKEKAVMFANYINKQFDRNPIFLRKTILEQITADNKPHFLTIFQGGKEVGCGWGEHVVIHENSFSITRDKEWEDYLKNDENRKEERTIIYLDKDFYIKEYACEAQKEGN